MLAASAVVAIALIYLGLLFAVASWGDRSGRRLMTGRLRAVVYSLALAVYCTSWTFFGSVGLASRSGLDFLTIYIGPVIALVLGYPLLKRIARIAKEQNTTSIADFIASRYGKSEGAAALVSLIAVIGSVPYIALQLKAVASSLDVFFQASEGIAGAWEPFHNISLLVAVVLAGFAVVFGTRNTDARKQQDGLMLAISLESVVKLVAFLAVGAYIVFEMFGSLYEVLARFEARGLTIELKAPVSANIAKSVNIDFMLHSSSVSVFATLTLLSCFAFVMLPRQFHMMVVENRDARDLKWAVWLFPVYLVLINVFVVPVAIAGLAILPEDINRDMTLLALPLQNGATIPAMIAFIGGLSAATAMIIVESIALAIMISNHLVLPYVLHRRSAATLEIAVFSLPDDLGALLLKIRRIAIVGVIALAYLYYLVSGQVSLASIGLVAFAAMAQFAPALFGGLFWRRATARGACAGMIAGALVWFYTLLIPSLLSAGSGFLADGPFGLSFLRPTALFGIDLDLLPHSVLWSLGLNILCYVGFSFARPASSLERLQAKAFVGRDASSSVPSLQYWNAHVTVNDLQATVARYLGEERARRSFANFATERHIVLDGKGMADAYLMRYAEHLLSSVIGVASSRHALSLVLQRHDVSSEAALQLIDNASTAIQYSRDLLQHGLDHAAQGITVLDRDLHVLCWNQAFIELYDFPSDLVRIGIGLDELIRFNAKRGSYGPGAPDTLVAMRLHSFAHDTEPVRLKLHPHGRVIEIRSNHLPDGGLVTTYTDVTQAAAVEETRERANEILEKRVRERTEELTHLNSELLQAKAVAEDANASKTRFLAAASHDILQPLNAAKLYSTSLLERDRESGQPQLAENVSASLDSVEEILTALLDISRLDSGAMKAEWSSFPIDDILRPLRLEYEPVARGKGLDLVFMPSSLNVRSDRRLLRRLVQNLVSNAIKYTPGGKVLVGVRRRRGKLRLDVFDTGIGIPAEQQKRVFQEFQRLDQGAKVARGLGLGLSIVERIAKVLGHPIKLESELGAGTRFSIEIPTTAASLEKTAPVEVSPPAAMPLSNLLVLVIDNEPAILEGMRDLLTRWGCIVVTAGDAREALLKLRPERMRPGVVIADYHLDTGTGLDAIVTLRWRLGRDIPAILLTADRSATVREEAEAKDVYFLNKPLKPAALRALLGQWRPLRLMAAE